MFGKQRKGAGQSLHLTCPWSMMDFCSICLWLTIRQHIKAFCPGCSSWVYTYIYYTYAIELLFPSIHTRHRVSAQTSSCFLTFQHKTFPQYFAEMNVKVTISCVTCRLCLSLQNILWRPETSLRISPGEGSCSVWPPVADKSLSVNCTTTESIAITIQQVAWYERYSDLMTLQIV